MPRTRRLILQKARSHPARRTTGTPGLPRLAGTRFQVLFHSPPGVLFTIPSRYSSAIGHQGIFRLTGWSRPIHTGFHEPRATRDRHPQHTSQTAYGAITLSGRPFAERSANPRRTPPAVRQNSDDTVPQPRPRNPCRVSHTNGLATIRFRSPLLTESLLFSSPAGTEMFHFPAFPPRTLCIQMRVTAHDCCRVTPFGHPRITARLTTPRGLSRPPTSFIGS